MQRTTEPPASLYAFLSFYPTEQRKTHSVSRILIKSLIVIVQHPLIRHDIPYLSVYTQQRAPMDFRNAYYHGNYCFP